MEKKTRSITPEFEIIVTRRSRRIDATVKVGSESASVKVKASSLSKSNVR